MAPPANIIYAFRLHKSRISRWLWHRNNDNPFHEGVKNNFYFSINHRMVRTEKGKDTIRNIPDHLLLTETEAPFTFNSEINGRVRSIENTLEAISTIKGKSKQ